MNTCQFCKNESVPTKMIQIGRDTRFDYQYVVILSSQMAEPLEISVNEIYLTVPSFPNGLAYIPDNLTLLLLFTQLGPRQPSPYELIDKKYPITTTMKRGKSTFTVNLNMTTRWGILSTSKISHDFVLALETLPAEHHQVVAVAAKDKSRAKDFADDHGISTYYGSYEELGNDPNVDIVYIGALNHQHYLLTKLMLEKGKPVLCEKPFCINTNQLDELIKLSKEKQLFLMEAMWSRFTPAYQKVLEEIQNGTIGTVLSVHANFGRQLSNIERIWKKEVGGGSILDLGVYTLHLVDAIFGPSKPKSIVSKGILNSHGTDENISAILKYPEGKIAIISTHTRVEMDCSAYIYGTNGTIKIHYPFHASQKVTVNTTDYTFEQPKTRKSTLFPNSVQLRYEIEHVRQCLTKGLIESPVVTLNNSYIVQETMDELRKQIGVQFEEDKTST